MHSAQVERTVFQFELAGFDFGEIQDVVDDGEQRFAAGINGFDVTALLVAERGFEQQAGHGDDAVHGRADFVAHVGQKFGLGAGGGFGGDAGGVQFAVGAGQFVLEMFGAQGGADAGAQFRGFEGLGQVIHRAQFEAAQFVVGAVPGGEDDDRDAAVRGGFSLSWRRTSKPFMPGRPRSSSIRSKCCSRTMASACGGIGGVGQSDVVLLQQGGEHLMHLRVVFDQQDL